MNKLDLTANFDALSSLGREGSAYILVKLIDIEWEDAWYAAVVARLSDKTLHKYSDTCSDIIWYGLIRAQSESGSWRSTSFTNPSKALTYLSSTPKSLPLLRMDAPYMRSKMSDPSNLSIKPFGLTIDFPPGSTKYESYPQCGISDLETLYANLSRNEETLLLSSAGSVWSNQDCWHASHPFLAPKLVIKTGDSFVQLTQCEDAQ